MSNSQAHYTQEEINEIIRRALSEPAARERALSHAELVEIVAEDRPGLLYDVASAISSNGGNIEVVLIDTQAHKAIDVFYVTADGAKLTAERQAAIRVAVENAVGVAAR